MHLLLQVRQGGLDLVGVIGLHGLLQPTDAGLDLAADLRGNLLPALLELLLGLVDDGLGLVLGVNLLPLLLVFVGMGLGIVHHLLDLLLGEATGTGDGDLLLLSSAQVLGGDIQDAVGVDVEGDLDLRHAPGGLGNAVQVEDADGLVGGGHLPFALEDMDFHGGLVVAGGGEDFALLHGDGGVPGNQLGEDSAQGLDAQGEGGHIQQEHILHLAAKHAALDGGAHGHALIGVDALVGGLPEDVGGGLVHQGHSAHAAHHHHLVDGTAGQLGVPEAVFAGDAAPGAEAVGELLQLRPGQGDLEVLGPGGVRRDEGEAHFGAGGGGEFALGLFRSLLQALESHGVVLQVDAIFRLEGIRQPVDDRRVEVVAAQMGVAVGGHDLAGALAQVQDGDIEGAAAQVVDGDFLILLLVHAVGQGGCGGFVDDPADIQAGDAPGILGGLALAVVEIGGNRDDRVRDALPQIGLRIQLQLLENHGRNLGRSILLVPHLDGCIPIGGGHHLEGNPGDVILALVQLPPHETLDGIDGAGGVGDGLALGLLAHQAVPILGEGDHGRRGAVPLGVGDDLGFSTLHDGHARIRGAQVNAQHLSHDFLFIHNNFLLDKASLPSIARKGRRCRKPLPEDTPRSPGRESGPE